MWPGLSNLLLMNRIRSDRVCLSKLNHKWHCGFFLALSWITHSWGSQLTCYVDTHTALWRCLCGEELRFPNNTQRWPARHVSEWSAWRQIFQPQPSLQAPVAPATICTSSSPETLTQNYPAKLPQDSWPMIVCEVIHETTKSWGNLLLG